MVNPVKHIGILQKNAYHLRHLLVALRFPNCIVYTAGREENRAKVGVSERNKDDDLDKLTTLVWMTIFLTT